ncbi:hypothetical protein FDZ71_06230, partial [bacterium]
MSLNCPNHEAHEWRLRAVEDTIKEVPDVKERLTSVEASAKSAHHRLDKHEDQLEAQNELTKAIYEMGTAIKQIVTQQQTMLDIQKKHEARIAVIEG